MITPRRLIAPIALLALSLQLLLSVPTEGLVLCVGSDGHVAVESGDCRTGVAPDGVGCDELGYPAPCNDTPLAARELVSAKAPRAGDPVDALAPAPLWAGSPLRVVARRAGLLTSGLSDVGRTPRNSILRL
jgi:hypothetical protein